jgi:O-methyltransferase
MDVRNQDVSSGCDMDQLELTTDGLGKSYLLAKYAAQHFGPSVMRKYGDATDPVLRLYDKLGTLTVNDIFRAKSLLEYLELGLRLHGDLIECGVYRCGTSVLIGLWLRERHETRQIYLCDVFSGLPMPDRTVDRRYEAGSFAFPVDRVERTLADYGLRDLCVLRPGLFADTLPSFDERQRFAFAHVDGDLYNSTTDCLTHLYPKLVDGAPMVFDDYYDQSGGVMRAVNEHATRTGEIVHLGPVGQATIIKGMTAQNADVTTFAAVVDCGSAKHSIRLSTDRLRQLTSYATLLREAKSEFLKHVQELDRYRELCFGAPR